ncbi:Protein cec-1., putative [Brugia malayi]|uniref:Protein cec-1., putative n=1 Tax=Brugia malayi TaxID=6279 RepID=A0A4E9F2Q0_BRUMA|nr:Protein cec-1., putative [Brugia malayi]VIO91041.1 Protein cec-1., putative [Brugia malayi]
MDPLDGQDVYAAEKILKSRTRKGKTEYLIKWKGWSNQHNTWEPSSNILNENLFTESGFSIPSDFKGGTRKGNRRSNRGRKRKVKEISDSDDSDDDNHSYDEGASESHSEGSEVSPKSSIHSRLGTPIPSGPVVESSKSSKTPRKRGPKSKKILSDVPMTSIPTPKVNEVKHNDDSKLDPKEEKPDEEQVAEDSLEMEAEKELDKKEEAEFRILPSETMLNLPGADKVRKDSALSEAEIFRTIKDDESKLVEEKNAKRVEIKLKKPEVFEGRSGSVQVVSNGQEQVINRLAFVVEGTSGLSRSSEQLQLHDYGDSDERRIRVIADQLKNETKIWTDANNTRFESFQYNGSHTITENSTTSGMMVSQPFRYFVGMCPERMIEQSGAERLTSAGGRAEL